CSKRRYGAATNGRAGSVLDGNCGPERRGLRGIRRFLGGAPQFALINAAPARELRRTSDSEMDMSESTERREKARRRVLKRALIVFNRGHCSMRCQILNISEFGAQVMPSDILLCPS